MGEWKRVFLNPGRLGILLLLTVLSGVLFLGSLMTRIGPGELERAVALGAYKGELTERYKEKDPEEILRLAEAEEQLLTDVYSSYNHFIRWDREGNELPPAFSDDAEIEAAIAHLPYLLEMKEDPDKFNETLWMYVDTLHEVSEDAEYIACYTDYLKKVQKQTEEQSKTSIFGKKNSFSLRNLQKTAKEFGRLLGLNGSTDPVEVRFGNNTGVEKWLDFRLGDYFGLLLLTIFVMAFLEERKKGLWSIIRTAKGGRRMLGIHRVLILLTVSILSVLLLNLLPLALSCMLQGGHTDLLRPIQSVQSFRTCTVRCTIGGWIALYTGVKILSGLFIGLFVWFIMGSVSNAQLSLAALLPVLGAEYALFTFLPVQSIFNLFKYLNLFSYVHTSALYTEYLNIDFFGFPIGNRQMMLTLLPVLLIAFTYLCIRMQAKRYPEGNRDLLSRITLKVDTVLDAVRRRFTIGMWEGYKVLFLEFGIVILAVLILASGSLSYAVWTMIPEDMRTYYMYVRDIEGPVGSKKMNAGTDVDGCTADADTYLARARENAENSNNPFELLHALDMLEEKISELREKGSKENFEPWIIYEPDFNAFYGEAPVNRQRLNAMIAILFMVFLCVGINAYERQSGVVPMLRSLKYGRAPLFHRKLFMMVISAVFVWGFVWLRELTQYISLYGKEILDAPVRNLSCYAEFPFNVSIRGFFAILYGTRLAMLIPVGYAVLCLSYDVPNVRMSYLLGTAVLVIPALFVVLGLSAFQWVSPLIPVSSAELFLGLGQGRWWCIFPFIVWLSVGHAALKKNIDQSL
ncbi:MAG: hypothetical protein IJL78_10095 [Lachnospiraceae bacterium]|nr:hypothetical protein [Lachnospiraceae bacterium]